MPMAHISGLNIHYQIQGCGDPLLLIMGYRGSSFMWGPELLKPLSRSFQVITFDNRGTGKSDKPNTIYTLPMMADDAAGLLHHLGIARASVFGVSMGGMIAQELALRHPKRVKRLVLGCTTCGGPLAHFAPVPVIERLLGQPHLTREEALQQQWSVMFSPDFRQRRGAFLDCMTARALAHPTPSHTTVRHMMAIQRFNTYGRLGQILAPTLVLTGSEDILLPPANSYLLAARIPNATLHVFPGAGHGFFWEQTPDVIDVLTKFCDVEASYEVPVAFHTTDIDAQRA